MAAQPGLERLPVSLLLAESYGRKNNDRQDCRLAVAFNVLVPMVLWIWALKAQTGVDDAIKRIMFRQVNSLWSSY